MTPAQLDIVISGAFIYRRPDGSEYAAWSNMERFGAKPVRRSGALTKDDLQSTPDEVLALINAGLAA